MKKSVLTLGNEYKSNQNWVEGWFLFYLYRGEVSLVFVKNYLSLPASPLGVLEGGGGVEPLFSISEKQKKIVGVRFVPSGDGSWKCKNKV